MPDLDDVLDLVLSPIVYRILFEPGAPPTELADRLTDRLFDGSQPHAEAGPRDASPEDQPRDECQPGATAP